MGGGGNSPSVPASPDPTPTPSPVPTNVSSAQTEGERASNISQMKKGMLSTIKTSPSGVSGTGSDIGTTGTGKKTLGGS